MKGFEPGRNVGLLLPELGRLPARVESSAGERIALALYVRPETPIPWLDSDSAEVEYVGERGIYRAEGRVTTEGRGRGALVILELSGEPRLIQRRDFVRVDTIVPATVWLDPDGPAVSTYALNVSGGGFLLAGPATLAVGQRLRFSLRLPDDLPELEGVASVTRQAEHERKGCAIEEIGERGRDALVRFTFDLQRRALRRGTGL